MAKCGICGKDKENYLEIGNVIFDCNVPMCKECYHTFLEEHWCDIFNTILEYCNPNEETKELISDFDIMNKLLDCINKGV